MRISNPDQTLALPKTVTICPTGHLEQSLALLTRIRDGGGASIELRALLGQGGMAEVFEATQRSLLRSVAVKMPRGEISGYQAAGMVAEAIVTARLEHPGIVPVHALELGEDGVPRLVLKRIEGQSWADLLAALPPGGCPADQLEDHLRIWLKVAEALAFAHARGIIHRDIKPDNVMVGAFGEVYLLDWGVAVAFDEQVDQPLPTLNRGTAGAGTPHYMAPEQARAEADQQGPATDVFLMGATLYEVLSGRTPYSGRTLLALQTAASLCQPAPLPSTVDARLASLCLGAMAPEPSDRPRSVAALASSIERWVKRRPALALLADAEAQVTALEQAHAHGGAPRRVLEARFESIHTLLATVGAVLDDEAVALARGRGTQVMIEVALADDDDVAARRLLALPDATLAPTDRAAYVERTEAVRARNAEEARRAREHDPRAGRRQRGWAIAALGLMFAGTAAFFAWQGGQIPLERAAISNSIGGLIIAGYIFFRRDKIGWTVPNRLLIVAVLLATLGTAALDVWGIINGTPPDQVYVEHLVLIAFAIAIYTVGVEPRAWPAVPIAIAAPVIAAMRPDRVLWITAVDVLLVTEIMALMTLLGARRSADVPPAHPDRSR